MCPATLRGGVWLLAPALPVLPQRSHGASPTGTLPGSEPREQRGQPPAVPVLGLAVREKAGAGGAWPGLVVTHGGGKGHRGRGLLGGHRVEGASRPHGATAQALGWSPSPCPRWPSVPGRAPPVQLAVALPCQAVRAQCWPWAWLGHVSWGTVAASRVTGAADPAPGLVTRAFHAEPPTSGRSVRSSQALPQELGPPPPREAPASEACAGSAGREPGQQEHACCRGPGRPQGQQEVSPRSARGQPEAPSWLTGGACCSFPHPRPLIVQLGLPSHSQDQADPCPSLLLTGPSAVRSLPDDHLLT